MSIKYDVVDCWECPLNGGGNWNPGHCMVSARGKGGDDYRYVPGPVCPLVLLDAANAENEILCQRNLSDPLIQATTKHLQAEIEQLHESLAAKERECEELRKQLTYEKADHAVTMDVLGDLQSFLPEDSALRSDEIYKSQFEGGER